MESFLPGDINIKQDEIYKHENFEKMHMSEEQKKKKIENMQQQQQQQQQQEQQMMILQNTVIKVIIDQTVGSAWYTILFILTIGALRGYDFDVIRYHLQQVSTFNIHKNYTII